MLEHSYFFDFDDNDVVAFSEVNLNKAKKIKEVMSSSLVHQLESTITSHSINNGINYPESVQFISGEGKTTPANKWTQKWVHCKVLKLGAKEWQKGKIKVRISVEFYPDEPETIHEPPSPLDDIRQSMS